MHASGTGSSTKKPRPINNSISSASFLVRPKLGPFRTSYGARPMSNNEKRRKSHKKSCCSNPPKMDNFLNKRKPNYAETAYREAVSRLRILMAESYIPVRNKIYTTPRTLRDLDSAGEETDNQSVASAGSRRFKTYYTSSQRRYYNPPSFTGNPNNVISRKVEESASAPPELMVFIERQEEYIDQLEKESHFCKEELAGLLSKVKEVISENEYLHEKQKSKLIKSVYDHLDTETETETDLDFPEKQLKAQQKPTVHLAAPSIVFESRISELEAQLTQARIDIKNAQEENSLLQMKLKTESQLPSDGPRYDYIKRQLDQCQREKDELNEKVKALETALKSNVNDQVKRSLDVAEQAQYEKNAAEMEIRRLKDELERQHLKMRDAFADQGRRISDEKSAVERRYTQQIEQLNAELGVQWEQSNKLQLELDKQRRENADLRRENAQKQALIEELKKDMQNKILTLQSDIGLSGAEKSALEQKIASLNMEHERSERQLKQEIGRLQAEIQSLRQRLDRADTDLIYSRRENIRLNEQIASLEKEINMNAALSEERAKVLTIPRTIDASDDSGLKDKELTAMVQEMENKHAATVADLESMIHSQTQLMDKLSSECHALTRKLEDSSHRHKEEIRVLQTSLDRLNDQFNQTQQGNFDVTGNTPYNSQTPNTPVNRRQSFKQESSETPTDPHRLNPNQLHYDTTGYSDNQYVPVDLQQYSYDPNGQYMSEYDPNIQIQYDPSQQQQQQEEQQYLQEEGNQYYQQQQSNENYDNGTT
ncbi:hypothetical protein ABEB36_001858 [Hypothenemus hampei]|uniref:Serologically defined colon cancer antigen 8 n=1 Tax=Hypothenemus hampei TaxID=57062 RepID=A0ABD1FFY5_HYPHA